MNTQKTIVMQNRKAGRRPRFPQSRQQETVQAWEHRPADMNLEEFLQKQFGSTPDGTPVVAPQTFYGWYQKWKTTSGH